MARSKDQVEQEAEENRRKLLAAEVAFLALLLRARGNERSFREAILEGRAMSRNVGLSRLAAEVAAAEVGLGASLRALADRALDLGRANRTARSLAMQQARGVNMTNSLRRVAATENSQAFNDGRAKALRDSRTLVWRVWDATLDRRTCPVCQGADGTIVSARESFPLGEPGAVHPFCRCVFTIVTAEERIAA